MVSNNYKHLLMVKNEELDGPAVSVFGVQSRKLSNVGRLSSG
jgi:hypothetical protein